MKETFAYLLTRFAYQRLASVFCGTAPPFRRMMWKIYNVSPHGDSPLIPMAVWCTVCRPMCKVLEQFGAHCSDYSRTLAWRCEQMIYRHCARGLPE